ncbi:hypothetical protein [Streptomyces cyslabdanicus]|uniref:hypothetical protein n=1 Tax=Streptomyces cyslabdanicus TaxID=1470456 RepID=UPI0040440D25
MAKKKRTKAAKAARQAKRLQERVRQERSVIAQRVRAARQERVGDGVSKPPPENPVSVRTISAALESSRRRH